MLIFYPQNSALSSNILIELTAKYFDHGRRMRKRSCGGFPVRAGPFPKGGASFFGMPPVLRKGNRFAFRGPVEFRGNQVTVMVQTGLKALVGACRLPAIRPGFGQGGFCSSEREGGNIRFIGMLGPSGEGF
jgi:hypothetical protein